MSTQVTKYALPVFILLVFLFLGALLWVMLTEDPAQPVVPTPQPEACVEVKPEAPAELPHTGVDL